MMTDPAYQFAQGLHRKPLPHIHVDEKHPYPRSPVSTTYSHTRTRTTSSSIFPYVNQPTASPNTMYQNAYAAKRTPSTNTFSTTGSNNNPPIRQPSTDLRRSTSSRSGGSIQSSSYVASMRRQKATVWCDRAQLEDPRLLAQQRAAKMRAHMEVVGVGRTSTSGSGSFSGSGNRVTAKIRHHGKSSLVGYQPGATGHLGVGMGGVPMRLSATEVEGGDSDDDDAGSIPGGGAYHQRSGSGRSSVSSARRGLTYARQSGASNISGRWSAGHTPPSESEAALTEALNDLAEETPVPPGHSRQQNEYFITDGTAHRSGSGRSAASRGRAGTGGSVSSGERADALADLGGNDTARLASNSLLKSTITREKSTKNPDELRRRGSVDERTMTMSMSAGRLFVANPDVDSD